MDLLGKSFTARKSSICRICANNPPEPLISIYCGGSTNFSLKIMFYLPVKIAPNDGLPLRICTSCLDNILKWDDFYQSCIDADRRLKNIFFPQNVSDGSSTTLKKEKCLNKRNRIRGNALQDCKADNITKTVRDEIGSNESYYSRNQGERNCGISIANSIENIIIKEELDIREEVLIGEEVRLDENDEILPSGSLEMESMTAKDIKNTNPTFICPDCGLSFLHKEKLAIHSLEVHHKHHALQSLLRQQLNTIDEMHILKGAKIGTNSYRCKHCKRIFASPSKLKVHARTHTGERPFKCLLCDKTFRQTCHTVTHMKLTHFNIRKYECDICRKHFKVRSNYRFHMRTHKGENAFDRYFDELC